MRQHCMEIIRNLVLNPLFKIEYGEICVRDDFARGVPDLCSVVAKYWLCSARGGCRNLDEITWPV